MSIKLDHIVGGGTSISPRSNLLLAALLYIYFESLAMSSQTVYLGMSPPDTTDLANEMQSLVPLVVSD
jgi:hypothetical protein